MQLKTNERKKFSWLKNYNFEERNAFVFCYLMIGIPLIFFIVFWLYVNISSVYLGFVDVDGKFTLDYFGEVIKSLTKQDKYFGSGTLLDIIGRSLLLWVLVDVGCVLPSMLSSYVLYKKMPGAYVFRVIFMMPTILGNMVWVLIMKQMVNITGGINGPVIDIFQELGIVVREEVFNSSGFLGYSGTAFTTICILNVLPKVVGFNILITGAYARIPNELFEVGKLDGHGFIREFFTVSVPLVWPTIVVSMISNLSTVFTFEGSVLLYTGGNADTATLGFYLTKLTMDISSSAELGGVTDYGYPAALGMLTTAITIPTVLFGKYVLEKMVETVEY